MHSNATADIFRVDAAAAAVMTKEQVEAKAIADGNIKQVAPEGVLTAPFSITNPNLMPVAGGPAATGTDFSGLDAGFFTNTTYKGAVGNTNWLQGWTRFPTRGQ